ncbi:Lar family restriction alleviation protein [Desulfosporosinus sp. SB140]|uniref:Lar family restriction alleviation protein n=1 Tax=Desulfosporosinus paludis TaxID=3115649 RepID=UPI0038901FB2
MENLKPCPFCGGKAEIRTYHRHDEDEYSVWCTSCYKNKLISLNTFSYPNKEDAIATWNRRVI